MRDIVIFCLYMVVTITVTAQNVNLQTELKRGAQLRLDYQFAEALDVFNYLLQQKTDSTFLNEVLREITLCENGKNMLKFSASPTVVAYETVSLKEFYRYYSLSLSGFWAPTPEALRSALDDAEIPPFIYVSSENPDVIYFDSRGADGKNGWDIYITHRMPNNRWSAPERLSDMVNTPFDERFPYLCPDGHTLYFASNGHYGMGGYDLYRTVKDPHTGEWSLPENLGFPLSSTADDILYVPDEDNLYACFASTRNAGKDSITVYKIALAGTPVKQPLSNSADIAKAARLWTAATCVYIDAQFEAANKESEAEAEYYRLVQELQQAKQRCDVIQELLTLLRADYAKTGDEEERKSIAVQIIAREQRLSQGQHEIRQLNKQVQEQEYAMLAQGIVVSPTRRSAKIDTARMVSVPVKTALSQHPERIINLQELVVQAPIVAVPEVKDFTFRRSTDSQIFYDELIEGISYRLQVGVYSNKPEAATFKGYSPVFIDEVNGKWICSIGSFGTYAEAQRQANSVRRDFNDMMIVAYKNSKRTEIRLARAEEGKRPASATGSAARPSGTTSTAGATRTTNTTTRSTSSSSGIAYQVVLGNALPENLRKAVQQATSREIARSVTGGTTRYIVGPFNSKSEADGVIKALQQSGFTSVSLEAIQKR